MTRNLRYYIFAAFILIFSDHRAAIAQDHPPSASVVITMSTTDRAGRTQLKTRSDEPLKVGEGRSGIFYISANGTAGAAVASSDKPIRQTEKYRYAWDFEVKVTSTDVDAVTFDLNWHRFDLVGGESNAALGDHRVITLRKEDRHVLDLVPLASDAAYANVVVEVQASPVEDPAYAGMELEYELWLEHTSAGGEKTIRRATVTGRQGERSSFKFDPIPLPLNANGASDADNLFKMYLDGSIVGRVTPDGTLQVSLQSRRSFKFGSQGGGSSGGTKKIITKPGEVISIELPPEGGYTTYQPELPGIIVPRKGVSIGDSGTINIDFREFLAGAKTSIVLAANQARYVDYDTLCKLDVRERDKVLSELSPVNKVEVVKTHMARWLEKNRARLSSAQISFLEERIKFVTVDTYPIPVGDENKRRFKEFWDKETALFSVEDRVQFFPFGKNYIPSK